MSEIDPVQLTADLIRCPSVTPNEGGALVLLETVLAQAGGRIRLYPRGPRRDLQPFRTVG